MARSTRKSFRRTVVHTAFAAAATTTAFAGAGPATAWAQARVTVDDGSGWQEELAAQLREEEGCTLAYFSQIGVVQQNGRQVIAARAHCEDRRAFDVTRVSPPDEAFALHPCGTADERTC
jgi:spermidine/putrescine-binding protein